MHEATEHHGSRLVCVIAPMSGCRGERGHASPWRPVYRRLNFRRSPPRRDKAGGAGRPTGALKFYRDDLAIAERQAKSDPGNAGWQFDVALYNWRLASAGDEAVRRLTLIVATLRGPDGGQQS